MRKKFLEKRVTLFAAILEEQYELLREIAFKERKSLAEVTREAINVYLEKKFKKVPIITKEKTENSSSLSLVSNLKE